jgi:hypothetical protein
VFIVYLYDIIANDKQKFNRVKRRFYYHLNNLPIRKEAWRTKSAICVKPSKMKMLDTFFKDFTGDVIVYKLRVTTISKID